MAWPTKRKIGRPRKQPATDARPVNETERRSDFIDGIPVEPIAGTGRPDGRNGTTSGTGSGDSYRNNQGATGTGSTTTGQKTASVKPDLNVYAGALQGVSDLAAFLLKLPELGDLDDAEAMKLAKAIRAVQAYHPSIDITGEALAWIGLCAAVSQVYGPRIAAIGLRKHNEKTDKKKDSGPIPFTMQSQAV